MALWENYGNTAPPTSATSYDYYQKLMEEMRKEQALAAQQAASAQAQAQAQAANSATQNQNAERHQANTQNYNRANDFWYNLTQVPAYAAQFPQFNHYMSELYSGFKRIPGVLNGTVPSILSQFQGNSNPSVPAYNWFNQPVSTPMIAGPGYVNPATSQAAAQNALMNRYNGILQGGAAQRDYIKPEITPEDWRRFSPANRMIDMYGIQGPGYTQYSGTANNNTVTGGGGGAAYEAPTWNFGGGGGGYRRSSGGIGRAKALSTWYQGMINWNINKPQGG